MNNLDLPLDGTIKYDIVCLHKIDNKYSMPFHKHSVYELELYLSGDVNLITDRSTYKMEPHFLTLISPGTWHRTVTCKNTIPYERIVLNISQRIINELSTKKTNLNACFNSNNLGVHIIKCKQ